MLKEWSLLSAEARQEERFQQWLSPREVEFVSPDAGRLYSERVNRFIDVIQLKEPGRVPVLLPAGFFPTFWYGTTPQAVMYDYDLLRKAWSKYVQDFDMDAYSGPGTACPGRVFELLDYTLYRWPGHGTAAEGCYQCVEGEYMQAMNMTP